MGMQQCTGQARAYIIVAQDGTRAVANEPVPIEPRSITGVVMDVDVTMAPLDGGMIAADVLVGDPNGIHGIAADGRELRRQMEACVLLAGECREREVESWRHEPSAQARGACRPRVCW